MAVSGFHNGRTITTITGNDGLNRVDVDLVSGKRRMATDAVVTVEQLFGKPGFAASWFAIGDFDDCNGVGAAGDEIRLEIAAGCDPVLFPAIDITYTITPADVAALEPEISVRDNFIAQLNSDMTFSSIFKADDVKDNGIIFIESKARAEAGDRIVPGDFAVTPTGTTTTTIAFDVVARRGTETELVRSIDDPRQGILGISGSVSVLPTSFPNRFNEDCRETHPGGNNDLTVNGSGTPVVFSVLPAVGFDTWVTEIRIHGLANGVKFGKFLNLNSKLTNGIVIDIKTDDVVTSIQEITSTDDLKARFSSVGGFDLDSQAGGDHVLATRALGAFPFVIRADGAFGPGNNDYFNLTVQDNLSQVSELFCTVIGFEREP